MRPGGSKSRTMRTKSNGTRRYRSMNVVGVAGWCAKTVYGTRKHGRTGPMINAIVHHAYGHVLEAVARARFPIVLKSMLGTPWNQIPRMWYASGGGGGCCCSNTRGCGARHLAPPLARYRKVISLRRSSSISNSSTRTGIIIRPTSADYTYLPR